MAFLSLYPQIPGLYGPSGLLPIHGFFTDFDYTQPAKVLEVLRGRPTLLWFSGIIGLSPDLMLDLLCLVGTALGLLAALKPAWTGKFTFVALWVLYQSIYQVCYFFTI